MASAQVTTATMQGGQRGPLFLTEEAGFAPVELPGLKKAAILLVALGDELAKTLFQSLSESDVQRVTEEITRLGEIPAQQLTQVMTEFYGLLETQQYMVRGGPEYALRVLTEAFGAAKAETMLAQVKRIRERANSNMAVLQRMDPQQLSTFLESEHPQTIALVLAHVDAKRGSTILMQLGPELRVDVVKRLAEMRQFSSEMAQKVAFVLHRRMEGMGTGARKSYSGFKAVAELLNRIDQTASKGILEEIEHQEPQLAIGIRNLMFTFEDLLTVPQESIRELVAACDKRVLAMALKGGRENLKAHLFKAMSSRAVEMLKEDMDVMGPVRMKDVGLAQQELLALARQLEAEGKMMLKMEQTMISQFEEAWADERQAAVLPLEFESLDLPGESAESTSGTELDSGWKEQVAALEARLIAEAETARQQIAEARLVAAQGARYEMTAEVERNMSEQRAEMATHIVQFGRERERYFAEVEREVVSLALAIAERVLHREASLDPMLLRAAVGVALDKLNDESTVRLRVPEGQAPAWSELLAAERGGVVVVGENQMALGNAVLETVVGRVDLGVREQLKEIERGFFDLLEKRPA